MRRGFIIRVHRPYGIVGFKFVTKWRGCKLLNLQSAALSPGVINQTRRCCEPQNVFLGNLLLFAYLSVNSPTLPTNHSHRETMRE